MTGSEKGVQSMSEAKSLSYDKATLINAISKVMTCEVCPYPCTSKENSSMRNCQYNWYKILSNVSTEPWVHEVQDKLFQMFK